MIIQEIGNMIPMIAIPQFEIPWRPSPEVIKVCRYIGFVALLVWGIWLASQLLFPKQRNLLQQGGGGKIWQFIGAAFVIVILMDISFVPTILNWVLAAIVGLFNMLFGQ